MLPLLNYQRNPNHYIPWSSLAPRLTEPKTNWENWCFLLTTRLRRQRVTSRFFLPVDPNAVGNRGYMKLIKTPMDLQTIQLKVTYRQYVSLAEVKEDFDLIVSNCLIFHKKHSAKYDSGLEFSDFLDEEWEQCPYQDSPNGPVPKPKAPRDSSTDVQKRRASRSGSRKREKSLPGVTRGVRLNAFPDSPNEHYESIFNSKLGSKAEKQRLVEEIDQLPDKHFIAVLRIIQIRRSERGHQVRSISNMSNRALILDKLSDDIILELMDFVRMVKNNGPRLDQYLREMESRRYEIGLEQFNDRFEDVREKRNMFRENERLARLKLLKPGENAVLDRLILRPVLKSATDRRIATRKPLSNMPRIPMRSSNKQESEEHSPRKRDWSGHHVDTNEENETSHRSIKSSRASIPKSEHDANPFEQRKSGGAANVEASDVETKRIKLDQSRSRTDPMTENSRSSDRVESAAEPNKNAQQAFAAQFKNFSGPDDAGDSRRPVENEHFDHGARLAESRTIRSSCAPEKKPSSERAKSLAEPRVPRSSRAPENEKKRSTASMATRSYSSPRHEEKRSVEPTTSRSSRAPENEKKRSSDRPKSLADPRITRSSRVPENEKKRATAPMTTRSYSSPRHEARSSRALDNSKKQSEEPTTSHSTRDSEKENKRSSERAKSLAEPRVLRSCPAPENEKKRSTAAIATTRSYSSPRNDKKPSVEPSRTRSSRALENAKKRSSDRVESLPERMVTRSSRARENEKRASTASMATRSFSSPRQEKKESVEPMTTRSSRYSVKEQKRSSDRLESLAKPTTSTSPIVLKNKTPGKASQAYAAILKKFFGPDDDDDDDDSRRPVTSDHGVRLAESRTTHLSCAPEKKLSSERAKSLAEPRISLRKQEEQNQKEKMHSINERITRFRSARAAEAVKNVKEEKHVVIDSKKSKQCLEGSNGKDSQERKLRSSALYEQLRVSTAPAKTTQPRRSNRIADERNKHEKVSSFHKSIEPDFFEMTGTLDTSSGKAEASRKRESRQTVISPPEDEPEKIASSPTTPDIRINYETLLPRLTGEITRWERWCSFLIKDLRNDIRTSHYYKLDDIKRIFGPSRDFLKSPVDFQTIENKLKYRKYVSLAEVKKDLKLIRASHFGTGELAEDTAGYAYDETLDSLWGECPFTGDTEGTSSPEVDNDSDLNPLLVNELVEETTERSCMLFEENMWKETGPLVIRNVSGVSAPKKTDATRLDGQVVLAPQQEVPDTEVAPWAETELLPLSKTTDVSQSLDVEPTRSDDQIVLTPQQEVMAAGVASYSQMRHLFRPSDVSDTVGDETTWLQYETKYSADRAKLLAERVICSSERQEEQKQTQIIDRLDEALNRLQSVRAAKAAKTVDETEHVVDEPKKASQCLGDKRVVISSSEDEDETIISAAEDKPVESAATRLDDNVVADHDSDLKRLLVDEQVEKTVLTPQQVILAADLHYCAQNGPIIVPDINNVSDWIEVETTMLDDGSVPMFEPVVTQTTCDLEIEEMRSLDQLDSSSKTDVPLRKVLVNMATQTSEDLVADRAVLRTKSTVPHQHKCCCKCGRKRSASEMSSSADIETPPKKNLKHYFPVVSGGKNMELTVAVVAPPRKTLRHYFPIVRK